MCELVMYTAHVESYFNSPFNGKLPERHQDAIGLIKRRHVPKVLKAGHCVFRWRMAPSCNNSSVKMGIKLKERKAADKEVFGNAHWAA